MIRWINAIIITLVINAALLVGHVRTQNFRLEKFPLANFDNPYLAIITESRII